MPKYDDDEISDIYSEDFNNELEEEDAIDVAEEGFMQGYNEENLVTECANCKKLLNNRYVEEIIGEKNYRFCSERCATKFSERF